MPATSTLPAWPRLGTRPTEETSLRNCDEETRRRYFTRDGTRFLLRDRHRAGVRFFTCNLAAPVMPLGAARYDVILCRNMLIYFGEAAFMTLIERFARAWSPAATSCSATPSRSSTAVRPSGPWC